MANPEHELTPHRRQVLADKARRLYGKYCGTRGRGICTESFAVYHIGKGEVVVAEDLLAYLESQVEALRQHDPEQRLEMTLQLVERVRRHLAEANGSAD